MSFLHFSVPELPRLDDLIGIRQAHMADGAWILYCNQRDRSVQHFQKELPRFDGCSHTRLSLEWQFVRIRFVDPVPAGTAEVSARRMGDHQIPKVSNQ